MHKNHGLIMFKTWVQAVSTHQKAVASVVGLYPSFLPTTFRSVFKWVGLCYFHPQAYPLVFPTHFCTFTPVEVYLSPLSTPPIKNRNYVKIQNNKGVAWV